MHAEEDGDRPGGGRRGARRDRPADMAGDRVVPCGDRRPHSQRVGRGGVRPVVGRGDLDVAPPARARPWSADNGRPDRVGAWGRARTGNRGRSVRRLRTDRRIHRQDNRVDRARNDDPAGRDDSRLVGAGTGGGRRSGGVLFGGCIADQTSGTGGDGAGGVRRAGVLLRGAGRDRSDAFGHCARRTRHGDRRDPGGGRVGTRRPTGFASHRLHWIRDPDNRE